MGSRRRLRNANQIFSAMHSERTIESVSDFIAALQAIQREGPRSIWFRGHGRAEWRLRPSVHRSHRIHEAELAARFVLEAPARHRASPDVSDLTAWLPLMRHYGLATRLLDWTDSPLVAAYFAVAYEKQEGPRAIWVLLPARLNALSGIEDIPFLTHHSVRPLVEHAFGRGDSVASTVAVSAPQVDLRMALQAARYTIHGSSDPLDGHPQAHSFLRRFVIPEAAATSLRAELLLLGVRRSVLFPDLEHLAQELQEDCP